MTPEEQRAMTLLRDIPDTCRCGSCVRYAKEALIKFEREARNEALEKAARWHDKQYQGGHCGESTSEIIPRQRRNKWHSEAAAGIRALKSPVSQHPGDVSEGGED